MKRFLFAATVLVFGRSQFRHPFDEKFLTIKNVSGYTKQDMHYKPFDNARRAHGYKISGGKIHEIEAAGIVRPYNSNTGWE